MRKGPTTSVSFAPTTSFVKHYPEEAKAQAAAFSQPSWATKLAPEMQAAADEAAKTKLDNAPQLNKSFALPPKDKEELHNPLLTAQEAIERGSPYEPKPEILALIAGALAVCGLGFLAYKYGWLGGKAEI